MSKADAHNVILASVLIIVVGLVLVKGYPAAVQSWIEKKVAS